MDEMRAPSAPTERPSPPRHRRLTRSAHDRMWAGVAGGLAEYFDLDPALVRLMWVAATVITAGAAVPVYILAWIILPRDDRPPVGYPPMTDYAPTSSFTSTSAPSTAEPGSAWWQSEPYAGRPHIHRHHPRTTGIVLVTLGVLLLAANAGVFSWIEWRTMWPLIFIGLGVMLLGRQSGWWGR